MAPGAKLRRRHNFSPAARVHAGGATLRRRRHFAPEALLFAGCTTSRRSRNFAPQAGGAASRRRHNFHRRRHLAPESQLRAAGRMRHFAPEAPFHTDHVAPTLGNVLCAGRAAPWPPGARVEKQLAYTELVFSVHPYARTLIVCLGRSRPPHQSYKNARAKSELNSYPFSVGVVS